MPFEELNRYAAVAVAHAVIAQGVAEAPDFGDDARCVVVHGIDAFLELVPGIHPINFPMGTAHSLSPSFTVSSPL
jgi:hypothetical protein